MFVITAIRHLEAKPKIRTVFKADTAFKVKRKKRHLVLMKQGEAWTWSKRYIHRVNVGCSSISNSLFSLIVIYI